jgi:uncharacterized protein (DUF736 family)
MTDYDNTNSGVLFANDKREKDTHPNMTGKINVDGVDYWLSAWTKTSKNGNKFLSLSVKPMEARAEPAPADFIDDDLDLPF